MLTFLSKTFCFGVCILDSPVGISNCLDKVWIQQIFVIQLMKKTQNAKLCWKHAAYTKLNNYKFTTKQRHPSRNKMVLTLFR